MNSVLLIGRLTRDPELRYVAQSGKAVCNFSLAVNREYDRDKADFFRVVVWGKTAENVANYLGKGSQVAVSGSIQINSYDDRDGNKRYQTDIVASRVEFLDTRKGGASEPRQSNGSNDFMGDFASVDDDDVPF